MLHLASVGVSMIPRLKTLIQCVFLLYFKSFNYVHFNLKMYYATKKMDIICNSFVIFLVYSCCQAMPSIVAGVL